jgi:hypothetical protein
MPCVSMVGITLTTMPRRYSVSVMGYTGTSIRGLIFMSLTVIRTL